MSTCPLHPDFSESILDAPPAPHYGVIIVGAGLHGLCAAHTFLKIQPSLSVLLLEEKPQIGGVWSRDQIYPGLRANNLQGYYEFTDFPMLDAGLEDFGVGERSKLSGEAVNAYIEKYAKHWGLERRVRCRSRVKGAEFSEEDERWNVEVEKIRTESKEPSSISLMSCDKLVVATGQASNPAIPDYPGQDVFEKPMIHSANLASKGKSIRDDKDVEHVTIIGGSKSAHDAVYMFATAGKNVTWLTRKSGRGAMPLAKSYTQIGPWKVWLEGLLMLRPLSWFGAAPWSDGDGFKWIRSFLHRTNIGMWMVKQYFAGMTMSSLDQSGILKDEKTKQLIPDESLLWYGTQASTLTYETDFYDLVKSANVEIIRDEIEFMDQGTIVLQRGQTIETDAVVFATGYQYGPSFPILPFEKQQELGIPVTLSEDHLYRNLEIKADKELFFRFPLLKTNPRQLNYDATALSPWRLWRFIAPPSQVCNSKTVEKESVNQRNLAYLSTISCYQATIKCELTSLWTYAYLFDKLDCNPQSTEGIMYEATLWSRFGKLSRPMGMQGYIADFLHDAMPYYDLLLRDLGLRSWRKGWGWFGEVFGKWYEVKDYAGVVDEWINKEEAKTRTTIML